MAVAGWVLDKSAAARRSDPVVDAGLRELEDELAVCSMGLLEQLFSAQSAPDYENIATTIRSGFRRLDAPSDILDRALVLQRDLAHHHGLWHRIPIPDLIIAETALHHGYGVVHVDGDYDRIAEVRPLTARRLR